MRPLAVGEKCYHTLFGGWGTGKVVRVDRANPLGPYRVRFKESRSRHCGPIWLPGEQLVRPGAGVVGCDRFKPGERVRHFRHRWGWGVVVESTQEYVKVRFRKWLIRVSPEELRAWEKT